MSDENDLRRLLAERAADAPDGRSVAESVLAALPGPARRRPVWLRWGLPAAAVAAVATIAAVIGVTADRGGPGPIGASRTTSPLPSSTAAPTTGSTDVPTPFVVTDISVSPTGQVWAIGNAYCTIAACHGYLLRSDQLGGDWKRVSRLTGFYTPSGVGRRCTVVDCVDRVRFRTATQGYLFSARATYLTNDGGRTWTKQSDVPGFRTTDMTVGRSGAFRVGVTAGRVGVERAGPAGGWAAVRLPGGDPAGTSGLLTTGGQSVYAAVQGAKGSGDVIVVSRDAGSTWNRLASAPCPTGSGLAALSTDPTGVVLVFTCRTAGSTTTRVGFVNYRTDVPTLGATLDAGQSPAAVAAVGSSQQVLIAGQGVYRATDTALQTFVPVTALSGAPGPGVLAVPASGTAFYVGRDGTRLWVSRDAGQTWTASEFR